LFEPFRFDVKKHFARTVMLAMVMGAGSPIETAIAISEEG
jgi:hypothetical protein